MAGSTFRRLAIGAAVAGALLLSSLAPAMARSFTDAEKASLATTIADFDTATRAGDFERIVATIPPKVMDAMAVQFNMNVDGLRAAVIEQSRQALASITLVSFGMDLAQASYAETADGTPYALIPTETVVQLGNDKMRAGGDTLALLDDNAWYLVRVSEQGQADLLKQVYPAFADVEFKPGTMETVTQ